MPFFFLSYFLFECFKVFLYSSSFRVCIYLLHHIYYFLIFPFRLYCWRCEFRHRRDHLLLLLLFLFFISSETYRLCVRPRRKKNKAQKNCQHFLFSSFSYFTGFFFYRRLFWPFNAAAIIVFLCWYTLFFFGLFSLSMIVLAFCGSPVLLVGAAGNEITKRKRNKR